MCLSGCREEDIYHIKRYVDEEPNIWQTSFTGLVYHTIHFLCSTSMGSIPCHSSMSKWKMQDLMVYVTKEAAVCKISGFLHHTVHFLGSTPMGSIPCNISKGETPNCMVFVIKEATFWLSTTADLAG